MTVRPLKNSGIARQLLHFLVLCNNCRTAARVANAAVAANNNCRNCRTPGGVLITELEGGSAVDHIHLSAVSLF